MGCSQTFENVEKVLDKSDYVGYNDIVKGNKCCGKGGEGMEVTLLIDGHTYEVLPITLSSTLPDDEANIKFLFEALKERIGKHGLIEIEREPNAIGEISHYTVVVLKKV